MNTTKFLNNYLANNADLDVSTTLTKLRQELYSKGICWTDSASGNFATNDSFRVILYVKSNATDIDSSNAMVGECNGMVLLYQRSEQNLGRFTPLVIPLPNFAQNKVSITQVNANYRSGYYDLYEALDATVINLYHYNGLWRISTTKGYDVGDYEFANEISYMEAFTRIAKEECPGFDFEMLSKNYCYSMAIRFDQYHLFDETKHIYAKNIMKSYIYMLQAVEIATMKIAADICTGIPYQSPIVLKSAKSVFTLIDYAKHAYAKYMKAYTSNQYKYRPLYGYILRANRNSVSNAYKNILIASSLFKIIKHGLYRNRMNTINGIIAKMYLHRTYKEQSKILFQQFASQFNKLDAMIDNVCENTHAVLSEGSHRSTDMLVRTFSTKLIEDMTRNGIIDNGTLDQSAIYDYLHSMHYIQYVEPLIDA